MFYKIKTDISRYFQIHSSTGQANLREKVRIFLFDECLHAVLDYRVHFWVYHNLNNVIFRKMFTAITLPISFWYKSVRGIKIHYNAEIEKGFFVGHSGGVLIGPISIGENCSIAHNVTIGIGGRGDDRGLPKIGNNVWIGTMSVIFGKIEVGNNTTILPGTVLSKSIPDKVTVGGNPGRIILRNTDNDELLHGTSTFPGN
jgi:serine O-acetyltransferase